MNANISVRRELSNFAFDIFVSVLLFIVAVTFSGAAQAFVTPNILWLYAPWYSVGLLPFCFYARHRGVLTFDRWDLVAYSPIPFVFGIAEHFIPNANAIIYAGFAMFFLCGYVRRLLPKTNEKPGIFKMPGF